MGSEGSRGVLGGTMRVQTVLGGPAGSEGGFSRVRDILGGSRMVLGVLGGLCVGLEGSRWVTWGF